MAAASPAIETQDQAQKFVDWAVPEFARRIGFNSASYDQNPVSVLFCDDNASGYYPGDNTLSVPYGCQNDGSLYGSSLGAYFNFVKAGTVFTEKLYGPGDAMLMGYRSWKGRKILRKIVKDTPYDRLSFEQPNIDDLINRSLDEVLATLAMSQMFDLKTFKFTPITFKDGGRKYLALHPSELKNAKMLRRMLDAYSRIPCYLAETDPDDFGCFTCDDKFLVDSINSWELEFSSETLRKLEDTQQNKRISDVIKKLKSELY